MTQVRHLVPGDILVSGFVVMSKPVRLSKTPAGKVVVRGHYPGSPIKDHVWNPSTTVNVLPTI